MYVADSKQHAADFTSLKKSRTQMATETSALYLHLAEVPNWCSLKMDRLSFAGIWQSCDVQSLLVEKFRCGVLPESDSLGLRIAWRNN